MLKNGKFSSDTINYLTSIEDLVMNSANGEDPEFGDDLAARLKGNLDLKRLGIQLAMLPAFVKDWDKRITFVSSIDTVIDCMKDKKLAELLPDLHMLIKLYLTVPLSNATAERTLSALRRVKTYLRSTMTQKHLNG